MFLDDRENNRKDIIVDINEDKKKVNDLMWEVYMNEK